MADRGDNLPEMPDNWREYSRMLGDLPLRSLPQGAESRLQRALGAATIGAARKPRTWLIGGLSVAAATLAVVVSINVFGGDQEPKPRATARPAVVTEQPQKRPSRRRHEARRSMAPQMTEHPVTIDTTPPRDLPLPQPRQPEITTGGDRSQRSSTAVPGAPPRPRTP